MSDERRTPRIPPRSAAEAPSASALLDDVLERQRAAAEAPTEPPTRPAGPLIGECVDDRHPVLRGRVRVRIPGDEGEPRWLPTLQGLALRVGDRVLLVRPGNGEEWIVTGVIDGFAARPRIEPTIAARLELRQDEALSIVSADGQPLVELSAGPGAPASASSRQTSASSSPASWCSGPTTSSSRRPRARSRSSRATTSSSAARSSASTEGARGILVR